MSAERRIGNEQTPQLEKFQALKTRLIVNGEENENGGFSLSNTYSEGTSASVTYWPSSDTEGEALHFKYKSVNVNHKLGLIFLETWRTVLEKSKAVKITPSASVQVDVFQELSPWVNHGNPIKVLEIPEQSREIAVMSFLNWIDNSIQK